MKSVLLVAYHFPPILGSSGVHRTLHFTRYLPSFGWKPLVLTVHPRAYPSWDGKLFREVPREVPVIRAGAWDTARHMSLKGRYPDILAIPDRWVSWWAWGVLAGLRIVQTYRPEVIWSTFPVATAHLIGATLNRLTKLPWIADFRDPMVQPGLPISTLGRRCWRKLEAATVQQAVRCCVTTPSALEDLKARYPTISPDHWVIVENGFDESLFTGAEAGNSATAISSDRPLQLVHSGILYAEGRNPVPFFRALRKFLLTHETRVEVILRGCGDQLDFKSTLTELGLREVVRVLPTVGYALAVQEIAQADGLLLFQGWQYDRQIPAKAYEYIRAARPVLALINPQGDTARMLAGWNHVYQARIDVEEEILKALQNWLKALRSGQKPCRPHERVDRLSRRARTVELAAVLNDVSGNAIHDRDGCGP